MKQNKVYAVTGGIGSGKSTVSRRIAEMGFPVYSCDDIYAELLKKGDFYSPFVAAFGNVFDEQKRLNRAKLSSIVFGNQEQLRKLNAITHSAVMAEVEKRTANHALSFVEVPLLFESNLQARFDGVIVVLREREARIQSVIWRSQLSREQVLARIDNQFDYEGANLSEFFVLNNNGNVTDLQEKIAIIISQIQVKKS